MSLQLKIVFISNIYLAYACKQDVTPVIGGNVWCVRQESLAQQTSSGHVSREVVPS